MCHCRLTYDLSGFVCISYSISMIDIRSSTRSIAFTDGSSHSHTPYDKTLIQMIRRLQLVPRALPYRSRVLGLLRDAALLGRRPSPRLSLLHCRIFTGPLSAGLRPRPGPRRGLVSRRSVRKVAEIAYGRRRHASRDAAGGEDLDQTSTHHSLDDDAQGKQ